MRYIEAPEYWDDKEGTGIFLAGGITDCYDWQFFLTNQLQSMLSDDYIVLNPRRKEFPIDDNGAAREQIIWEHRHLEKSKAIVFWFSPPTLNPIALFEYGTQIVRNKQLFVGCHGDYPRKTDVEIQTGLYRPNQVISSNLIGIVEEITAWNNGREFGKAFEMATG